jgi:CheY-like chemotaxis protein
MERVTTQERGQPPHATGWHQNSLSTAEPRQGRQRVLVVDDNEDLREYLALMLQLSGHAVRTARDGVEALEVAEGFRPDIIFLDLQMPRLDGYATCERLRQQPWGKDISIFAISGLGREEDRWRSEHAGFDAHLIKPVDPSALGDLL